VTNYTVLVFDAEPDEGGYWARVAELPGCVTQGETLAEVHANVPDAIEEWFHARTIGGRQVVAPPSFEITLRYRPGRNIKST
jgi:predicted RNase H-like HicB family nuclease